MLKHYSKSNKYARQICWEGEESQDIGINVLNCSIRIIVSEFEFQLHYYLHFWTNTLGKGMNSLIPSPDMG